MGRSTGNLPPRSILRTGTTSHRLEVEVDPLIEDSTALEVGLLPSAEGEASFPESTQARRGEFQAGAAGEVTSRRLPLRNVTASQV